MPIFSRFVAVFLSFNCQRWDYSQSPLVFQFPKIPKHGSEKPPGRCRYRQPDGFSSHILLFYSILGHCALTAWRSAMAAAKFRVVILQISRSRNSRIRSGSFTVQAEIPRPFSFMADRNSGVTYFSLILTTRISYFLQSAISFSVSFSVRGFPGV